MNIIATKGEEIEVISLMPYSYDYGKGEKVLRIEVSAESIGFGELRGLLENNTEPIEYFEGETLVCEYVGYGVFEAQYKDGVYHVELHKASIVEQMTALLTANERLNTALVALDEANGKASATIAMLEEQNAMLMGCIMEMSEIVYA